MLELAATAALPGGIGVAGGSSALTLTGGGVVNLAANSFKRALGTGQGQVSWSGSGGFSASGGSRAVNLGGNSQALDLGH